MLRTISAFGFILTLAAMPDSASAGGGTVFVPGIRGSVYIGGYGIGGRYFHPFDDGYDYPFGYGEYAEYGPWASRGYAGCYAVRRLRIGVGWRQKIVRVCE